ncbi:hypothetical protein N9242_05935 [Vicingaceae bacterium]|nr:hypothetical protein [Vicingaceae bacterium]
MFWHTTLAAIVAASLALGLKISLLIPLVIMTLVVFAFLIEFNPPTCQDSRIPESYFFRSWLKSIVISSIIVSLIDISFWIQSIGRLDAMLPTIPVVIFTFVGRLVINSFLILFAASPFALLVRGIALDWHEYKIKNPKKQNNPRQAPF